MKRYLLFIALMVGAIMMTGAVIDGQDSTGKPRPARVDAGGFLLQKIVPMAITGNAKSYCVAITAADVDFTLSTTSNYFKICATGNGAYLTFKDVAPGVTTAIDGFDMYVASGQCHVSAHAELLVAVIGATAGGFVCFYPLLVQ